MSKESLGLRQARSLIQIQQVITRRYHYRCSKHAPKLGVDGVPAFYWLPTGLIVLHPDNLPLLQAEAARVGGVLEEMGKEEIYGSVIQAFPQGASPPG